MDSWPTTQECQDGKKISATLGTIFMEKSRNELLISKGQWNFNFLQVLNNYSVYLRPSKNRKNNGGMFHVKW